jgi:hypothetical protein
VVIGDQGPLIGPPVLSLCQIAVVSASHDHVARSDIAQLVDQQP